MNCLRASRLVRTFALFGSTGSLGVVGSPLALLALLVACADLHSPPPAGAAGATGEGGTIGRGGASAAYGGGGASGSAGSSSTGQGGGAGASSGGIMGLSGSGGTAGGSGAQAGAGGTTTVLAGASGQAGEAGGAGSETACPPRKDGDIQAWLYQEITNEQDNEIHPAFLLTRTGLSVPLKQLAIRYYFSGEGAGDWVLTCLWVTKAGDTGHGLCDEGVTMKVVALDPPTQQVDQYLEISFAGVSSATLSDGFPIEARVMFWRTGHPLMNLGNDYSFVPNLEPVRKEGTRTYKQTSKVTVYRNGELVWGEEPCP